MYLIFCSGVARMHERKKNEMKEMSLNGARVWLLRYCSADSEAPAAVAEAEAEAEADGGGALRTTKLAC